MKLKVFLFSFLSIIVIGFGSLLFFKGGNDYNVTIKEELAAKRPSAIVHHYDDELLKAEHHSSFEQLDKGLTINPHFSNDALVSDELTDSELIELFYRDDIVKRNTIFFEVPHFIETYYPNDEGMGRYDLMETKTFLYTLTKDNLPFTISTIYDGEIQVINGYNFYADYNGHYDGFSSLSEKDDISYDFVSDNLESNEAYYNPYRTLSEALSKGETIFFPYASTVGTEFEKEVHRVGEEIHYSFYFKSDSFLKTDAYYEFSGSYKFVFDKSMNLIRFKKYFMGDENRSHQLDVHYALYYRDTLDWLEDSFDYRMIDTYKELMD